MKSFFYLRSLLLLIGSLLLSQYASATHIRAGEITARRLDPQSFTYEITLTGYADRDSQVLFGSNGTLDFGDGTFIQLANDGDDIPRTAISEDTWRYELKVRHTFPSARSYVVSFREFYRNDGILNMDNSVNMPFYIETVINIDPFLGVNNTPQLLVPPVDKAGVGKLYLHNPGAYDIDGDSLSFRLVPSRQDPNTQVANYRYPPNTFPAGDPRNGTSLDGGQPTITLDPVTGDLVWNTPGTAGEYNVAFYIEEWRKIKGKYYPLGYVTRDMQIIVEPTDNEPPVIELPEEICVVAGEKIEELIRVTDPDGDNVEFVAFGGVFNLGATFAGGTNFTTPASVPFVWQTECSDVRSQPYLVVFRARDLRGGGVSLTDIKTLKIRVVGPPPEITSLTVVDSKSIEVRFNPATYPCPQARTMQVWRREGSAEIPPEDCVTGMPPGYGYELIDVRAFTSFPFIDNAKGAGLKPGATYCYRMVAVYPDPQGGESIVSEEKCITLPARIPLMTRVSIEETDETEGEIQVQWIPGPDLQVGDVQQPYKYDLYRAVGFTGGEYTKVAQDLAATTFTDRGLNTRDNVYNYYVMLKDANGVEFDRSSSASTVRLTPVPGAGSIRIQWEASVPWSNRVDKFPLHDVYRNRVNPADPDQLVLIARVNVIQNGFTYLDNGVDAGTGDLQDDVEYCYYVVTSGSYSNPRVPEPLLNKSQRICSSTRDEVPPCPPLAFDLEPLPSCEELLKTWECGSNTYVNTLRWTANVEDLCIKDFSHWLIYYSANGEEFVEVGQVNAPVVGDPQRYEFEHTLEGTMAGFYYIQAVDRSGNLSTPSEIISRDNCPSYWLPNVITRDSDFSDTEDNDVLRPAFPADVLNQPELYYRCPRFVDAVKFTVYNRWGKQVYEYNSATAPEPDIYIRWDGRTSGGEPVSSGTYYYLVEVTYNVLDPANRTKSIKGWVYVTDVSNGGRRDTQ